MPTMDDLYGDGSDHEACTDCGSCDECGDCVCDEGWFDDEAKEFNQKLLGLEEEN